LSVFLAGPGQERFPVNLPKSKIKSTTNPIPGAVPLVPGHRTRKSKPEGVTYGGAEDVGFITTTKSSAVVGVKVSGGGGGIQQQQQIRNIGSGGAGGSNKAATTTTGASHGDNSMSVGINPAPVTATHVVPGGGTTSSGATIDMDEFTNQLDPQSLATLETLIQSEQGREIIQTLDLEEGTVVGNSSNMPSVLQRGDPLGKGGITGLTDAGKPSGWDHSYTNANSNRVSGSGGESSASSVTGSNAGAMSPTTSSAANSPGGAPRNRGGRTGAQSGRASVSSRMSEGKGFTITGHVT
jgi:hypothetical protein